MTRASPQPVPPAQGDLGPVPGLAVGVPAYYYPGPVWEQTLAAGPAVRYLVVNPGDGPGVDVDPAYGRTVEAAGVAGVRLLGYVHTGWGRRPAEDVLLDVRRYREWYGVTGVFLDEASTARSELGHYGALTAAIRRGTGGALVALNPGVPPDEEYVGLADLLVQFEGPWSTYASWTPPAWQSRYPRDRFWHVVYGTPACSLRSALCRAARSAGVVYVTDRVMTNPWDGLPSYWEEEVEVVAAMNECGPGTARQCVGRR